MNQLANQLGRLVSRLFPRVATSLDDFVRVAAKQSVIEVTTAANAHGGGNIFVHMDYFTFSMSVEGMDGDGYSLRYSKTLPEIISLGDYCASHNPDTQLVNLKLLLWSVDTARYLHHKGFTIQDPVGLNEEELQALYEKAAANNLPVRFPINPIE